MKRIIATVICIALIATMAISGSVAYLTDEEKDENVFQVGSVDIVQHEQQRGSDGSLEDYKDPTGRIHPMVETNDEDESKDVNQKFIIAETPQERSYTVDLRNPDYYANYIDKIVTVENEGTSAAYVRNIIAIPTGLPKDAEDVNWLEIDWFDRNTASSSNNDWTKLDPVKDVYINGRLYDIYVFNYTDSVTNNTLLPKDITYPTLLGFGLSKYVDYDEEAKTYYYKEPNKDRVDISFDPNELKILVATQAVQSAGFEKFDDAFNYAFKETFGGAISDKNHPWYDPNAPKPSVNISAYSYAADVLPSVTDGITLSGAGKSSTTLKTQKDNTINAAIEADDLTIEKVTIEAEATQGFAIKGDNFEMKDSEVLLMAQNGVFQIVGTGATISNTSILGNNLVLAEADTADTTTTINNSTIGPREVSGLTLSGGIVAKNVLNGTLNITYCTIDTSSSPLLIENSSGAASGTVNVKDTTIKCYCDNATTVKNVATASFTNVTFDDTWSDTAWEETPTIKLDVQASSITFDGCHFADSVTFIHGNNSVTFKNCTFGTENTKLTAENFSQVFTCKNSSCTNHTFDNTTT